MNTFVSATHYLERKWYLAAPPVHVHNYILVVGVDQRVPRAECVTVVCACTYQSLQHDMSMHLITSTLNHNEGSALRGPYSAFMSTLLRTRDGFEEAYCEYH